MMMDQTLILIARIWINRWQRGYRSAQASDMCVALAYGPKNGSRLDLKPRGQDRKKLSLIMTHAVTGHDMIGGYSFGARREDSNMGVSSSACNGGVRVERGMLEVKTSSEEPFNEVIQDNLGQAFEYQLFVALEPWSLTRILSTELQHG